MNKFYREVELFLWLLVFIVFAYLIYTVSK